jgi:hypothetical protein
MRILSLLVPAGLALMPAALCQAGEFDGKKPFVCALVDVASCVPGHECARETADAIGVPHFYAFDVAKAEVGETSPSGSTGRTSKIDRVEHPQGVLLLSGVEGDRGWTASIGEDSGKLSMAVVGDRVSFVVFGDCMIR